MRDSATRPEPTTAPQLTLPTWAVGVPAVLLLGFLTLLGRAGVGIQLFGLPLGAYLTPVPLFAVGILLVTRRGRAMIQRFNRPQRRVAIAVGIAVGAGVLRAAAQGTPTLLRFQDLAYLLHLPWIIVGMAAMKTLRSDEERLRVLRWIAWPLALVLTLHWARGVIAPVGWLFEQLVASLEVVSDKPSNLMKDGDRALYGIALAALAMHLASARSPGPKGMTLVGTAGLLLGTQLADLSLGGSRGALVGVLLGAAVLAVRRPSRAARGILLGTATLSFLLSSTVVLATAPDPAIPATAPAPAPAPAIAPDSAESLSTRERYQIVTGRRTVTATLEQLRIEDGEFTRPSEVSWRIAIWTEVIDEWNSSWKNRLFGVGFGTDIEAMTVPGRQGSDGLNRGVHSIAFTVLARQGLAGLLSAAALLLLLVLMLTAPAPPGIALLSTALVIGSLDVFLEGVQAPVLLWSLVGMLAWGDRESRGWTRPG